MTYVAGYDLNGDGILSQTDIDRWLCKAGDINLGPGLSYRPADANLDGFVDGLDFIIWNANKFMAGNKWSQADFNADGFVDGQDFVRWNTNKFQMPFSCNPLPLQVGGDDATEDPRPDLPLPVGPPESTGWPGRSIESASQTDRDVTEDPILELPKRAIAGDERVAPPTGTPPQTNGGWRTIKQPASFTVDDRDDATNTYPVLDAVFSEW